MSDHPDYKVAGSIVEDVRNINFSIEHKLMLERAKPKTWSAAQVDDSVNFLAAIDSLTQAVLQLTILIKDD